MSAFWAWIYLVQFDSTYVGSTVLTRSILTNEDSESSASELTTPSSKILRIICPWIIIPKPYALTFQVRYLTVTRSRIVFVGGKKYCTKELEFDICEQFESPAWYHNYSCPRQIGTREISEISSYNK
jgi:hypothetical protein